MAWFRKRLTRQQKLAALRARLLDAGRPGVPIVAESRMDYLRPLPRSAEMRRFPGWIIVTPEYVTWALLDRPDLLVGVGPEAITALAINSQGVIRLHSRAPDGVAASHLLPDRPEVYLALKLLASPTEGSTVLYGILRFAGLQHSDVSRWTTCPICGGELSPGQASAECRACRRFFSNPGRWLELHSFEAAGSVWVETPYPTAAGAHDLAHQGLVRPWRLALDEREQPMLLPDAEMERIIAALDRDS